MEDKKLFQKVEKIKMPIRIGILAGTVVILLGAFMYLVYLPNMQKIDQTTKNVHELEGKLNRAIVQRKQLPEKRAEKEQVDAQFNEALKLLPNDKEIPELLTQISALGADSELDLRSIRPQGDRKKEFYKEIPISLELKGTYHNVAIFFEKVGRMDRIMNIQNVNMKPVSPRLTELNVTCEAITYTFRED